MISNYLIAFFTLILISIAFNIYRKASKSKNVLIHALSVVPATGALMSITCFIAILLIAAIIPFVTAPIGGVFNPISGIIFAACLFGVPLIVLIVGIFILRRFARRNLKKYIYLSYIGVFFASAIFGITLCLCAIIFPRWHSQDVDGLFSYDSKKRPALCAEYNLRLSFDSGKKVNLHIDTCGLSNYTLFKLDNGDIFMYTERSMQNSYIVSPEKEEVFLYKNGCKYKLQSEGINGWAGTKGGELTIYPQDNIDGTSESYKAKPIKAEGVHTDTPLGKLGVYHFQKAK